MRAARFKTAITGDAVAGVANPYNYINALITRMMAADNLGLQSADFGCPYVRNSTGNEVADLQRPYFGPTSLIVDLNCGYRTKLRIFDRRIDCDVALNLQNAFADDELIPIVANADGSWGTVRVPPERRWALTASFRY